MLVEVTQRYFHCTCPELYLISVGVTPNHSIDDSVLVLVSESSFLLECVVVVDVDVLQELEVGQRVQTLDGSVRHHTHLQFPQLLIHLLIPCDQVSLMLWVLDSILNVSVYELYALPIVIVLFGGGVMHS